MAAATDLIWADADWTATTTESIITFGGWSTDYSSVNDDYLRLKPFMGNSFLYETTEFGFGKSHSSNLTEFYTDINNFDSDLTVYGNL